VKRRKNGSIFDEVVTKTAAYLFDHFVVGVSRRISCKDLGGGDCQGWLWKKKEGSGLMAGRWVKFWFVLHNKNLFYYKDPEVVITVFRRLYLTVKNMAVFLARCHVTHMRAFNWVLDYFLSLFCAFVLNSCLLFTRQLAATRTSFQFF